MIDKIFVIGLVIACHVFSVCVIGFCLPGLSINEPPSYGSTIAVVAATVIGIEYLLPQLQMCALPPLMRCFYKILAILLWANAFFQVIWLPFITFLAMALEVIGRKLQTVPVLCNLVELNALGMEALEIIVATYFLYLAMTATGLIDLFTCYVTAPKIRGRPARRAKYR